MSAPRDRFSDDAATTIIPVVSGEPTAFVPAVTHPTPGRAGGLVGKVAPWVGFGVVAVLVITATSMWSSSLRETGGELPTAAAPAFLSPGPGREPVTAVPPSTPATVEDAAPVEGPPAEGPAADGQETAAVPARPRTVRRTTAAAPAAPEPTAGTPAVPTAPRVDAPAPAPVPLDQDVEDLEDLDDLEDCDDLDDEAGAQLPARCIAPTATTPTRTASRTPGR